MTLRAGLLARPTPGAPSRPWEGQWQRRRVARGSQLRGSFRFAATAAHGIPDYPPPEGGGTRSWRNYIKYGRRCQ